jgi:hypothetical protein
MLFAAVRLAAAAVVRATRARKRVALAATSEAALAVVTVVCALVARALPATREKAAAVVVRTTEFPPPDLVRTELDTVRPAEGVL